MDSSCVVLSCLFPHLSFDDHTLKHLQAFVNETLYDRGTIGQKVVSSPLPPATLRVPFLQHVRLPVRMREEAGRNEDKLSLIRHPILCFQSLAEKK